MPLLVVGSVALDSIITPFGEAADAVGGSAVHFSIAGSLALKAMVIAPMSRLVMASCFNVTLPPVLSTLVTSPLIIGKLLASAASAAPPRAKLPRTIAAIADLRVVILGFLGFRVDFSASYLSCASSTYSKV